MLPMKNLLSILSILSVLVWQTPASFAKNFSDIPENHPNYLATKYLSAKGIIKGYKDDSFKPNSEINRAELLKILLEDNKTEIEKSESNCFNDSPYTAWYSDYLCAAKKMKIVNGYEDGSFKPWQAVNKVEAIKMIAKVYSWEPKTVIEKPFLDTPINEWYTADVHLAKLKNLLATSGQYFYPANNISRGEIAEIIYRYLIIMELKEEKFSNKLLHKIENLISEAEENQQSESTEIQTEEAKIKLADGEILIVLSWNKETNNKGNIEKLNFETHLVKPDEEEIYFLHKIDTKLNIIMESEEDSEKVIVRNLEKGNYEFFVYKYSGEKNFSEAGAKVEIYDSKGLAALFIPEDRHNIIWKVFDLNGEGEISEVNKVGYCDILKNFTSVCPQI